MRQRSNILGKKAEFFVSHFLESAGHKIVQKNFKKLGGEIDIISTLPGKIIFTEVKYRKHFEDYEGIVDTKKAERIFFTSAKFITENPLFGSLEHQFDIIFINEQLKIEHIQNYIT